MEDKNPKLGNKNYIYSQEIKTLFLGSRNLTEEELKIYEDRLNSEAIDTGINIFDLMEE